MDSTLSIASDLAQTSLQTPEEALAQARGEVESATQVADATTTSRPRPAGAVP